MISQLTRSLFSPPKNLLTRKDGRKEKGKTALEEGLGGKKRTDVSSSFIFYFIPFPFRRNGRHGRSRSLALEEHERERERGRGERKGGGGDGRKKAEEEEEQAVSEGKAGRAPLRLGRVTLFFPRQFPRFGETGSRESLPLARVLFLLALPVLSRRSRASSRPPSSTASPFSGLEPERNCSTSFSRPPRKKTKKTPPPEFTLRECPPVPVTWSSSTWAGPTSRRPSRR